jgi:hypothetical protein
MHNKLYTAYFVGAEWSSNIPWFSGPMALKAGAQALHDFALLWNNAVWLFAAFSVTSRKN